MKKILIILSICLVGMSAFNSTRQAGITGSFDPADGAKKVWAVSGTDSVGAIPVGGKFSIVVKPGNWNLYVEAIAPYQNTKVEAVLVLEGAPTDIGVIKLGTK